MFINTALLFTEFALTMILLYFNFWQILLFSQQPIVNMQEVFIPKIDISPLFIHHYTAPEAHNVIQKIDKACRQVGFFTVINHPIKHEILQNMFKKVKQFFYLSPEQKLQSSPKKWNPTNQNVYRGYFPSNVHGKQGLDIQDLQMKEIPQKYSGMFHYEINKFPTCLSEQWNETIQDYFTKIHEIAIALIKAVFYAYNKESEWEEFEKGISRPFHLSTLRFNYYPKKTEESQAIEVSAEDGAKLACETHVDSSVFTILSQDSIGGLQVKNKQGIWQNVPYDQDALVVNTGRTTELLTNGDYKPTYHRVLLNYHERISIPYFLEPAGDTILDPAVLGGGNGINEQHMKCCYQEFITESLKKFKEYQR